MAVAVEMNFKGATLDQYDQVLQKMGLTPGGATPQERSPTGRRRQTRDSES